MKKTLALFAVILGLVFAPVAPAAHAHSHFHPMPHNWISPQHTV